MEKLKGHIDAAKERQKAVPRQPSPEEDETYQEVMPCEALPALPLRPPESRPFARHLALARVRQRRGSDQREGGDAMSPVEELVKELSRSESGGGDDGLPHRIPEDTPHPSSSSSSRPRSASDGQRTLPRELAVGLRPTRPPSNAGSGSVIAAMQKMRSEEELRQMRVAQVQELSRQRELRARSSSRSPSPEAKEEEPAETPPSREEESTEPDSEACTAQILHRRLQQRHAARIASPAPRTTSPETEDASDSPDVPNARLPDATDELPSEDAEDTLLTGLASSGSFQPLGVEPCLASIDVSDVQEEEAVAEFSEFPAAEESKPQEPESDDVLAALQQRQAARAACSGQRSRPAGRGKASEDWLPTSPDWPPPVESDQPEPEPAMAGGDHAAFSGGEDEEREDWDWGWDRNERREKDNIAAGWPWPDLPQDSDSEAQASPSRPTTRRGQRSGAVREESASLGRWSDEPCDADEALGVSNDDGWADFLHLQSWEGSEDEDGSEDEQLFALVRAPYRDGSFESEAEALCYGLGWDPELELEVQGLAPRGLWSIIETGQEYDGDSEDDEVAGQPSVATANLDLEDESLLAFGSQSQENFHAEEICEALDEGMSSDTEDKTAEEFAHLDHEGKAIEADETAETECLSSVAPTEFRGETDDDGGDESEKTADVEAVAPPEEAEERIGEPRASWEDHVGARCAADLPELLIQEGKPRQEDGEEMSEQVGTLPLARQQKQIWQAEETKEVCDERQSEDPEGQFARQNSWSAAEMLQAVYCERVTQSHLANQRSASKLEVQADHRDPVAAAAAQVRPTSARVENAARGLAAIRARAQREQEEAAAVRIQLAWRVHLGHHKAESESRARVTRGQERLKPRPPSQPRSKASASAGRRRPSVSNEIAKDRSNDSLGMQKLSTASQEGSDRKEAPRSRGQRPHSSKVSAFKATSSASDRPPSAPRPKESSHGRKRPSVSELLDQMQGATPRGLPRLGSGSGIRGTAGNQRLRPSPHTASSAPNTAAAERSAPSPGSSSSSAAALGASRRQRSVLSNTIASPRRSWG